MTRWILRGEVAIRYSIERSPVRCRSSPTFVAPAGSRAAPALAIAVTGGSRALGAAPALAIAVTGGSRALGAALALAIAVAGCSRAPSGAIVADPPITAAGQVIAASDVKARLVTELGFASIGGVVRCSYAVLDQDVAAVFLWVLCEERAPGTMTLGSASSGPVVVTVDTSSLPARVRSVRPPRSGGDYATDVRKMFPRQAVAEIFDAGPRAEDRHRVLEAAILAEARGGTGTPVTGAGTP